MIVTRRHLSTIPGFSKKPGFCVPGIRAWCKAHDVDMRDLMRNGIDSDRLLAIGDAFALAAVKWAAECEAKVATDGR